MADPIGVVGTAVGLVSFGLQLYSAVATYIDTLDGRRDDLASARAQLDSLRDSLTTIQSALPVSSSVSTATSTVPAIVKECKKQLDQLEGLLQDLVGSNTSGSKLKERIKTLKFPFRWDSLMKLEDRLHKTNSVFQTALSVLNLLVTGYFGIRFANVEAATAQVLAMNANVAQMSTNVQDLRIDFGYMSSDVNSAISTMKSNNNEVISRLDLSVARLTATAGQSLPQISNNIASIERQMQKLSAWEERLQTLSLLEQALSIQDAQGQANPLLVLQRLLSKPSQTREIYDSIPHSKLMSTRSGWNQTAVYDWPIDTLYRNKSCSCLYRNNRRRTSRRFHSWLRTEMTYHEHDENCESSKLALRDSRRTFKLTATQPFSFLPWSLGFSFALTTGAGGFSISPNITLRPIVDGERSPVFRILDNLRRFLVQDSYTHTELSCSLSTTKKTILELYSQKKAFVNETTKTGESAMSIAIVILISIYGRASCSFPLQDLAGALSDMIVELVQAGLPADLNDNSGTTRVSRVSLLDIAIHTKGLLPVLYEEASPSIGVGSFWYNADSTLAYSRWYRELNDSSYQNIFEHIGTERFGCGPLSAAIIKRRDETQILDLVITRNVSEVNSIRQTPLHLAAGTGKTQVLTALLRTEGIQGILHTRDFRGAHAIDYAGFHSGVSCCNGQKPVLCFNCSCTTALDLLLSAEGCLESYFSNIHTSGWYFFRSASHSSKIRLITELKLRRDELKQLALSCLGNRAIQRYKLDGSGVLDHHGIKVVECLTELGIQVPTRIRDTFFDYEYLHIGGSPSIYRMLAAWLGKHDAQLLFDLGFRDIDETDEQGHTLLIKSLLPFPWSRSQRTPFLKRNTSLMLWLVQQGADLSGTAPDLGLRYYHKCSTVAHLVSSELRGTDLYATSEDAHIVSKIVSLNTTDDCKCYCTETGCTPASILLCHIIGNSEYTKYRKSYDGRSLRFWQEQQMVLMDLVSSVAKFFESHFVDLTIYRHECPAALRVLTFEALGIRHTCGCRLHNKDAVRNDSVDDDLLSDEDVEDMWEEDAHMISLLNELQTEFGSSFDNSGMNLAIFLVEVWAKRMEVVFQELDQVELSEAELRDAESLGVQWDTCEEQRAVQHHGQPHPKTLQEYLRAIRKIADE